MTVVYFDASALVKLLVEEPGSDIAAALWDGCDAAVSSRIAYPEVCAALAAANRNGDLDADTWLSCSRHWDELWTVIRPVELTSVVERSAGRLARVHSLSGADAIHLASALAIRATDPVVAVWDRRLYDGVVAEGLTIEPPTLP